MRYITHADSNQIKNMSDQWKQALKNLRISYFGSTLGTLKRLWVSTTMYHSCSEQTIWGSSLIVQSNNKLKPRSCMLVRRVNSSTSHVDVLHSSLLPCILLNDVSHVDLLDLLQYSKCLPAPRLVIWLTVSWFGPLSVNPIFYKSEM